MASGGAAAAETTSAGPSQGSCTLSRKSFAGSTGSSLGRGDRRQRNHNMVDTSDEELDNSQVG